MSIQRIPVQRKNISELGKRRLQAIRAAETLRIYQEDIKIFEKSESNGIMSQKLDLILMKLSRLEAKLDQLSVKISKIEKKGPEPPPVPHFSNLPELPMNTSEEFEEFEELLADSNTYRQTVHYIQNIGGNCMKDTVRRSLTSLFTNELAMQYSWKGQQNNKALQNKILMKALFCGVQLAIQKMGGSSHHEIEVAVRDWFRFAKRRIERATGKAV